MAMNMVDMAKACTCPNVILKEQLTLGLYKSNGVKTHDTNCPMRQFCTCGNSEPQRNTCDHRCDFYWAAHVVR